MSWGRNYLNSVSFIKFHFIHYYFLHDRSEPCYFKDLCYIRIEKKQNSQNVSCAAFRLFHTGLQVCFVFSAALSSYMTGKNPIPNCSRHLHFRNNSGETYVLIILIIIAVVLLICSQQWFSEIVQRFSEYSWQRFSGRDPCFARISVRGIPDLSYQYDVSVDIRTGNGSCENLLYFSAEHLDRFFWFF